MRHEYRAGGVFLKPGDDCWTADIHLFVDGREIHGGIVQCYGRSEDDARALRDRVLKGLT